MSGLRRQAGRDLVSTDCLSSASCCCHARWVPAMSDSNPLEPQAKYLSPLSCLWSVLFYHGIRKLTPGTGGTLEDSFGSHHWGGCYQDPTGPTDAAYTIQYRGNNIIHRQRPQRIIGKGHQGGAGETPVGTVSASDLPPDPWGRWSNSSPNVYSESTQV